MKNSIAFNNIHFTNFIFFLSISFISLSQPQLKVTYTDNIGSMNCDQSDPGCNCNFALPVEFGDIEISNQKTIQIELSNSGSSNLVIDTPVETASSNWIFTYSSAPPWLLNSTNPSMTINATFNPKNTSATGPDGSTLTMHTFADVQCFEDEDPSTPSELDIRFNLSGSVVPFNAYENLFSLFSRAMSGKEYYTYFSGGDPSGHFFWVFNNPSERHGLATNFSDSSITIDVSNLGFHNCNYEYATDNGTSDSVLVHNGHISLPPQSITLIGYGDPDSNCSYSSINSNHQFIESNKRTEAELTPLEILLYPNPLKNNEINLGFVGFRDSKQISILSLGGKLVQQLEIIDSKYTLNLNTSPGVYLLKVDDGSNKLTKRFIIEN